MARRSVNFDRIASLIAPYFRARRMRRFISALKPEDRTTLLDVGGLPDFWDQSGVNAGITIVNMDQPALKASRNSYGLVVADGKRLPFQDDSFDIVFSNSVIEHLSTWENQRVFAQSVSKAGRRLWVQTPAKWFPVELHLKSPFIHYFPASIQKRLIRNFTVWGLMTRPEPGEIDVLLREIRLLSFREMKELFPDCRIEREKFFLFTKSYIAIRE